MKGAFLRVGEMDVRPIVDVMHAHEDAFDGSWRSRMPFTPHRDSDTMILRGPPTTRPRDVLHSLEVVDSPMMAVPEFSDAVAQVATLAVGTRARAMIVRLKPNGYVSVHADEGDYADQTERYHVALETKPLAWVVVETERVTLAPGEVWWLDKHQKHAAGNEGETARYHLIVDVFR